MWWALAACSGSEPLPIPAAGRVLKGPFVGATVAITDGTLWVGAAGRLQDGGVYRFDSVRSATLSQADAAVVASATGEIGPAFAPCRDLDGDGDPDLLIGAPDRGDSGGTFWVTGPLSGTTNVDAHPFVEGLRDDGHAGAVVRCGDSDGDGRDEVAVSAPDTDTAGSVAVRTGTVDLFGWDSGAPDKIANLDTTWSDSHLGFRSGLTLGADLDGDGVGDLAVGGHGADKVHLLFGGWQGSYVTSTSGPVLNGIDGEGTGHAIASGDLDGDGFADLAVGAPLANGSQGAVWILPGPFDPELSGRLLTSMGRRLEGVGYGDQAGFSVAIPGDLNGDGLDDLLIGAPYAGGVGPEAGAVYLVLGPALVEGNLDQADALILGEVAYGRLGWSVAGGDLDGDATLAVAAPEADIGTKVGVGVVYLFDASIRGVVYPDAARARIDAD